MEISQHGKTVRIILERGPGSPEDNDGALDETKALDILKATAATMIQTRREDNALTKERGAAKRTILDDWTEHIATSDKLFTGVERFQALIDLARVAVVSCHVTPKAALADPANAAAARVINELHETDIEKIPAFDPAAHTLAVAPASSPATA